MARSLAEQGRMLNLGREHLWYFPGYSLLMSPLYLVSEHPYWLISAFQWVAAALLMLGVYQWARSIVPQWAVWIAVLSGVNAGVWFHAARVLSEVPFMCALVWAANAGIAACRSRSLGRTLLLTAAASVLLAITALIRPAGMMLAAGFGLSLVWQAVRHRVTWSRARDDHAGPGPSGRGLRDRLHADGTGDGLAGERRHLLEQLWRLGPQSTGVLSRRRATGGARQRTRRDSRECSRRIKRRVGSIPIS